MVFRLHLQKQAEKTSGKRKKQAASGKNKRKAEIISEKAEVRSRERLLFLFCRIFLDM